MTWAPQQTGRTDLPGMPAMAQAYARWANAHGGIDGRRLRVLTCNVHDDYEGAAHCASRAVDEGAVAVVGSYSHFGSAFMWTLEGAGIPYIGGYGVTEEELSSPLSYPVNGGLPALVAGNGRQLAAGGCDRVALVRPDDVGGDTLPPLLDAGLRQGGAAGAAPAADVRALAEATEYRVPARQALRAASGGPGRGCVTAVMGGRTDTFFDSFRRLEGSDGVVAASVLGSVGQSLVDRTGGAAGPLEGAYATGWYPVGDDPRWKQLRQVVRQYAFGDDRIDTGDPAVQTTWIAYSVLKAALESLGEDAAVTPHALRHVLNTGPAIRTGGLTPPLRWHFDDLLGAEGASRVVNTKVTYQRVRDGRLVAVHDGFVDVGRTLGGAGHGR